MVYLSKFSGGVPVQMIFYKYAQCGKGELPDMLLVGSGEL